MSTIVAATGAAGNWTDGTAWVGGTAPTAADDAQITSATTSITINAGAVCRSADFNGFTGTLTQGSTGTLTIGDGTAGLSNIAINLPSGATYAPNAASTISFVSTSGTQQTVTISSSYTLGNITFNGTGSDYAITASMTQSASSTFTHAKGTVHYDGAADNSGNTITMGQWNSSATTARTLTMGTSTVNVTSTNATQAIMWQDNTNLTFTCGTGTVNVSGAGGGINIGNGGGFATKTFNILTASGGGTKNFGAGRIAFKDFTYTATNATGNIFQIRDAFTWTATGTVTLNGGSARYRAAIITQTAGTQGTIQLSGASASLTGSAISFRDVVISSTGGAPSTPIDLSAISGGCGNLGNTSGITFTTGGNRYWVGNGGTWSDAANHWATSSNGSPALANNPLPQDDVFFDANSFSSASQTVTTDLGTLCRNMDWTGVTNSPTFAQGSANTIQGSLTWVSGMTRSGNFAFTFKAIDTTAYRINSANKNFYQLVINPFAGGSYTLDSAVTSSNDTLVIGSGTGTLNANNFNLSGFQIQVTAATVNMGSGTWSCTRSTTNNWQVVSGTINANTSTIALTSSNGFAGAGKTYYNVNFGGSAGTVSGSNTYHRWTTTGVNTITVTAGTTQTFDDGNGFGNGTNLITLNSTTATDVTFVKTGGGTVQLEKVSITDIDASPANTWYYGNYSTYVSDTGWNAGYAPSMFLMFG